MQPAREGLLSHADHTDRGRRALLSRVFFIVCAVDPDGSILFRRHRGQERVRQGRQGRIPKIPQVAGRKMYAISSLRYPRRLIGATNNPPRTVARRLSPDGSVVLKTSTWWLPAGQQDPSVRHAARWMRSAGELIKTPARIPCDRVCAEAFKPSPKLALPGLRCKYHNPLVSAPVTSRNGD